MTFDKPLVVAANNGMAAKPQPTKDELLARNARDTKLLMGAMVGAPVLTVTSAAGSFALQKLAASAPGLIGRAAYGGAGVLAGAALLGAFATVALDAGWGWIGLAAGKHERARIERARIERGENPYGS